MILMRLYSGLVTLSALTVAGSLLAGCSAFSDDTGTDGEVTVAAAFYPLAYVAERVTDGTGARVALLTQPGTEPHDLELTIKETAQLADADVVVYESGFQPAVDDAVEQNARGATLDATEVVDPVPFEEHADEHAEHADEEGHDEHDHGEFDPHFWQDPIRVADLADALADELADADQDHADAYRANAKALREDLTALDGEYAAGLADCERDTIVVSHDAFGYLEKYGLHVASIVGLSPDAEPTGAVLGELKELIKTEGITTVFSEPLKPALGESFANDLGLTNGVLDPVEGLTDATADQDYLSLMQANLATLRSANGCR